MGETLADITWTNVIDALTAKGCPVIEPDQIGFGKSSKPFIYYNLHKLARYNKMLPNAAGIPKVIVFADQFLKALLEHV
jgi:pimeloyl-ACP methyl ester carboxylesterase